jgi:hypothetical protein
MVHREQPWTRNGAAGTALTVVGDAVQPSAKPSLIPLLLSGGGQFTFPREPSPWGTSARLLKERPHEANDNETCSDNIEACDPSWNVPGAWYGRDLSSVSNRIRLAVGELRERPRGEKEKHPCKNQSQCGKRWQSSFGCINPNSYGEMLLLEPPKRVNSFPWTALILARARLASELLTQNQRRVPASPPRAKVRRVPFTSAGLRNTAS